MAIRKGEDLTKEKLKLKLLAGVIGFLIFDGVRV